MFCHNGFDTLYVVCADSLYVVLLDYLSAEFSTVNKELGRLMFWKARDLNRLSREGVFIN